MRFDGHVDEPRHLPRLLALVANLFVDDHDNVALGADGVFGKLGDRHFGHWKCRVRAVKRCHHQPSHFRIEEIFRGRLLGAVD